MRGRWLLALLAAVLLTVASCSQASEITDRVGDAAEDLLPGQSPGGRDGQPGAGNGATGPDAPGDPGGGTQPDSDGAQPAVQLDDRGPVGGNGRAYLRGAVERLVVEVDYQEGAEPRAGATDHLRQVLAGVVDKPGGLTFEGGNVFASDRRDWTRDALRAVADTHRQVRSGGGVAAVYVLYVRGASEEPSALGVAHTASEVALFPDGWRGTLGTLLGSDVAVERAVLTHELGHLLGLVNLTYTSSIQGREDPNNPGHSASRESVMFWAIESSAIGQVFSGPPPDSFDEWDRTDLQGLREGTL